LFSWIARDNAKPGRSIYESWVAQASNQWSDENLAFNQFEIELILVKAFEELTGQSCDLYQTHLWRYSKLETPSEQNCVSDLSVRLGLCGDWLRNSTVEGAWLSGYSMARSLIETKEA
jgi:predicted NAD/FAD-dependent oxidoreductase